MATTFQTEDFPTITAGMVNHARAVQTLVTDFTPGSKARTLLEAAAMQLDEFYQQVLNGLLAAIPVATFQSFNFPPLPAVAASGLMTVNISSSASNVTIPAGTVFTLTGLSTTYVASNSLTIPAGQTTGQLAVAASATGTIGNIAANQQFTASPSIIGFISATNVAAFSGGRAAETVAEQTVRFAAYLNALQRCNVAGIEYGLTGVQRTDGSGNVIETTAFVYVNDPTPAGGTGPQPVAVYVHNGVGETSSALVTLCQQVVNGYSSGGVQVPGYKAAGVPMTVYAASDVALNVGGSITALSGYTESVLATAANAAVANYIAGLAPGASYIQAQAYAIVMAIPGVYDWVPATIADVPVQATQKLIPGTMGIS